MADPYKILEIDPQSSDDQIRRRYLELVRRYTPDRQPERFAAVRNAYEKLRDPVLRMESRLFELGSDDSLDAVIADVQQRLRSARMPTATLLSLAKQP